jgi:hypothetical protein
LDGISHKWVPKGVEIIVTDVQGQLGRETVRVYRAPCRVQFFQGIIDIMDAGTRQLL